MTIRLFPQKDKYLRELLIEKNISIQAPCGGNGKCGKCKVKLVKGVTEPVADENGYVNACRTKLVSSCVFYIPDNNDDVYFNLTFSDEIPSFAICDVGTTNIKAQIYSKEFALCSSVSFKNPQYPFGSDVISRISLSQGGGYKSLSRVLREGIANKIKDVSVVYFCGNPTMIHFLAEVDPSSIGVYPFECVFKETKLLKKSETGMPWDMVLLPSASGYVGSDALCGIYKEIEINNKVYLIADLGTNGEISLVKNGKIYSATTAAGPAIEGASIEMGEIGGEEVIYGIDDKGNPIFLGQKARGINGGGFISLVSYLLKNNLLQSDGHMNKNKYHITDEVYITNKDISEFMVAKSAVRTAIDLLLKETDTEYKQIESVIITGGVCMDMKVEDLVTVGLIPKELGKKSVYVSSLALSGLFSVLADDKISDLEKLSKEIEVLTLSDCEDFEELFVENTFFD